MRRSAAKSLSSLSLGPERKVQCYNEYFINGYVFHAEEYGHGRKTHNSGRHDQRIDVLSQVQECHSNK
jgi:hypothetical protein